LNFGHFIRSGDIRILPEKEYTMNKSAHILLVEDNRMDVELTRDAFRKVHLKNQISVVWTGEEALDYLFGKGQYTDRNKYPMPDMILLDLKLPGIDGFGVLRKVKNTPILKRIPIIVLTSSTDEGDRALSYDSGVNSYLVMNKPIRVLYVDDNPHDRELVRDALEKESGNFKVVEAATEKEFKALLEKGVYDLVLSDFFIVSFKGLDVFQAVRAKTPDIPVVIVTGTGSEEIAVSAMKMGVADYVIKTPSHIRRLRLWILAVLEKERLKKEHKRAQEALKEYSELFEEMVKERTL
jgi:CheY-like chemotaxis protein